MKQSQSDFQTPSHWPSASGEVPPSNTLDGTNSPDQIPDAERDAADSAVSRAPISMTNGKVTIQVVDGEVRVCSPEASEPKDGHVLIGTPISGFYWPSKEARERGEPGEPAVCGYTVDAEVRADVARRLQLVDGLKPLPTFPGVLTVPVDQLVLGLVREAFVKGVSEPDEMENYVTRGLGECRFDTELIDVRNSIGRSLVVILSRSANESALADVVLKLIDAAGGSHGAARKPKPKGHAPQERGRKVRSEAPAAKSEEEGADMPCLVSLRDVAPLVGRTKRGLANHKVEMPPPDIPGRKGTTAFWDWQKLRPWLEDKFDMKLPERFPRRSS